MFNGTSRETPVGCLLTCWLVQPAVVVPWIKCPSPEVRWGGGGGDNDNDTFVQNTLYKSNLRGGHRNRRFIVALQLIKVNWTTLKVFFSPFFLFLICGVNVQDGRTRTSAFCRKSRAAKAKSASVATTVRLWEPQWNATRHKAGERIVSNYRANGRN